MGGNGRFLKWKISFYHRSTPSRSEAPPQPPPEYVCPLCNSLISDPVVVGSGHTFDRLCVKVCQDLRFTPTLSDGTRPDFSTTIPNLALRSAIPNWCSQNGVAPPPEKDYAAVEVVVKGLMDKVTEKELVRLSEKFLIDSVKEKPDPDMSHAITELTHRANRFDFNSSSSSTSAESVIAAASPLTLLPFTTRPACCSPYPSSSSGTLTSDEILNPNINVSNSSPDEEFIAKFKSSRSIKNKVRFLSGMQLEPVNVLEFLSVRRDCCWSFDRC